jgi:hypothetical protein
MDILGWTPTTPTVVVGNTTGCQVAGNGDFNGDHTSDVLWRFTDGTVGVWEINGFQIIADGVTGQAAVAPLNWHIVGTGDFDGNGTNDILWRADDGSVGIWEMNGLQFAATGVVAGPTIAPLNWHIQGTGDFNGDGKTDILWRADDGSVGIWEMNGLQFATTGIVAGPVIAPLNLIDRLIKFGI